MTKIEKALFLSGNVHSVATFDWSSESLILTVHPREQADLCVRAVFERPIMISKDDYSDGDRDLPWDIIGFDSEQRSEEDWRFCLTTHCIEHVWDSSWPYITKAP